MTAEQRRQERLSRLPTWKAAFQRGGIAALALFALLVIAFKANPAAAIPLALLAALLYVPAFHLTDTLLYRNRMRRRAREQGRGQDAD
jgi:preprotein translocase subunit SecF